VGETVTEMHPHRHTTILAREKYRHNFKNTGYYNAARTKVYKATAAKSLVTFTLFTIFYCFVLPIVLYCCDTTIRGEIKIIKFGHF